VRDKLLQNPQFLPPDFLEALWIRLPFRHLLPFSQHKRLLYALLPQAALFFLTSSRQLELSHKKLYQ
jgi:hypothetical protein